MAEDVDDVAAHLLARFGVMNAARLHTLAYYAQAWHLADHGERLFDDQLEATRTGPVVCGLRDKAYDGLDEVSSWPAGDPRGLGGRARDVVEWIARSYGSLPDGELARIVRTEAPWRLAWDGRRRVRRGPKVIDPAVMADYYGRLRTSPEVAVRVAVGSARLEGHVFGPREVDRLRAVADGTRPADDLVAEVIMRYQAS
jgi:uncharacterized phage-associated protein